MEEFDLTQDKEIIYLDNKSLEIVKSCVSALNSNKQVQKLLHPEGITKTPISENEQAILLDVEATCPNGKKFILHLKSKLDNYTIDTETNTIVVRRLEKSLVKLTPISISITIVGSLRCIYTF